MIQFFFKIHISLKSFCHPFEKLPRTMLDFQLVLIRRLIWGTFMNNHALFRLPYSKFSGQLPLRQVQMLPSQAQGAWSGVVCLRFLFSTTLRAARLLHLAGISALRHAAGLEILGLLPENESERRASYTIGVAPIGLAVVEGFAESCGFINDFTLSSWPVYFVFDNSATFFGGGGADGYVVAGSAGGQTFFIFKIFFSYNLRQRVRFPNRTFGSIIARFFT